MNRLRHSGCVLAVLLAAGCAGAGTGRPPGPAPVPARSRPPAVARPTARPPVPPQPGWAVASTDPAGVLVDTRTVALPNRHVVTLFRFRAGVVRYALHYGSQDPPPGRVIGLAAGAAVTGPERARLVAAFTGGFHLTDGVGGYLQEGRLLSPLRPGLASLVIDRGGAAGVGVWGAGLPSPGRPVFSVLQNLPPLLRAGAASPAVDTVTAWGPTLGHKPVVARCALGEDRAGDLVFAAGMFTLPRDLATALLAAGVRTAMELDINPEWVQLAFAHHPGGPLLAGVPGQHRPADQYLVGWTRDFVAVLAGAPAG